MNLESLNALNEMLQIGHQGNPSSEYVISLSADQKTIRPDKPKSTLAAAIAKDDRFLRLPG